MMRKIFLAVFTLMVCVAPQLEANEPVQRERKLPGFHQLNERISRSIRGYSVAKTDEETAEAVFGMVEMHRELAADPRFQESDTLQGYRRRLAAKLKQAEQKIARELAKRGKANSLSTKTILAPDQLDLNNEHVGRIVSDQFSLVGVTMGGPSRLLDEISRQGGFGGGAIPDFGPALVDLIQATITPKAWDVNGGSSTIVYYKPLLLLVVRAPLEVHEDINGGLGKLRE
jgi:hypothetical protein